MRSLTDGHSGRFKEGDRVIMQARGPMKGHEGTLKHAISPTRWEVICHGGMWDGLTFTIAEDFIEPAPPKEEQE